MDPIIRYAQQRASVLSQHQLVLRQTSFLFRVVGYPELHVREPPLHEVMDICEGGVNVVHYILDKFRAQVICTNAIQTLVSLVGFLRVDIRA